ncbi:hypothetical protein AB0C51_23735 [Streptomyces pathocidini]|uniref:hypothetical protein n=1 Tax=Streptomyces pathocidini TaxID=1650571 RepID=UPI0033C9D19B
MNFSRKATLTIAATMSLAIGGTACAQTALALDAPKAGIVSQATANAAIANARQGVIDKLTSQGATSAQITAAQQDFDKGLALATEAKSAPASADSTAIPGIPAFEHKTYAQMLELARQRLAQVKAGKPENERNSLVSSMPRAGAMVGGAGAPVGVVVTVANHWSGLDKMVNKLVNQSVGNYLYFDTVRSTLEGGTEGVAAGLNGAGSYVALGGGHFGGVGAALGLAGAVTHLANPAVLADPVKLRDALAGTVFSSGYLAGYLVGLVAGPVGAAISAGTVVGQLVYALATQGWDGFVQTLAKNGVTLANLGYAGVFGPNSSGAKVLQNLSGSKSDPSPAIADQLEKDLQLPLRKMLLSSWGTGWDEIARKQGKAAWETYQYVEQFAASYTAYAEVILDDAYNNKSDHSKAAHDSLVKNKQALRDQLKEHLRDESTHLLIEQKKAIRYDMFENPKNEEGYRDFGKSLFQEKRRDVVVSVLRSGVKHGQIQGGTLDQFSAHGHALNMETLLGGFDKAAQAVLTSASADLNYNASDHLRELGSQISNRVQSELVDQYGTMMKIDKVDDTWTPPPPTPMKIPLHNGIDQPDFPSGTFLVTQAGECLYYQVPTPENGQLDGGIHETACTSDLAKKWSVNTLANGDVELKYDGKGIVDTFTLNNSDLTHGDGKWLGYHGGAIGPEMGMPLRIVKDKKLLDVPPRTHVAKIPVQEGVDQPLFPSGTFLVTQAGECLYYQVPTPENGQLDGGIHETACTSDLAKKWSVNTVAKNDIELKYDGKGVVDTFILHNSDLTYGDGKWLGYSGGSIAPQMGMPLRIVKDKKLLISEPTSTPTTIPVQEVPEQPDFPLGTFMVTNDGRCLAYPLKPVPCGSSEAKKWSVRIVNSNNVELNYGGKHLDWQQIPGYLSDSGKADGSSNLRMSNLWLTNLDKDPVRFIEDGDNGYFDVESLNKEGARVTLVKDRKVLGF